VNVGGPVVQIAAGFLNTCAVLANGKVRCWGYGADGRLGYTGEFSVNAVGDNEVPAVAGDVDVAGSVVQVATGWSHTCVLLATGTVRC
jgi:alpha-tubulin suppressor-like RCC1 family protein